MLHLDGAVGVNTSGGTPSVGKPPIAEALAPIGAVLRP